MAKRNGDRKSFAVMALLINLFSSLTVFFFSPMEVVLINQQEFMFPFLNAAVFMLITALLLAGILTLVTVLLPRKIGIVLAGLSLGGGIAAYIQAMFLNGSMVALTGETMEVSRTAKLINLAIWAVLILAAVLLLWRQKKPVMTAARCAAAALILMQAAAMIGSAATNGLEEKGEALFLTGEGKFELSSGENVVEFVLDTADSAVFREMLERYPELNESLAGWTYYPNATSKNSRTYPSLTYMLTGDLCFFDRPADEYIHEAFSGSPFLPGLKDAETDIGLYTTDMDVVSKDVVPYTRNAMTYDYSRISSLGPVQLVKNLTHVALYKSMPYALKKYFSYNMDLVNMTSFRDYTRRVGPYRQEDILFYRDLLYSGMTSSNEYDKAYRFYHLWGNHPGYMWDQNLDDYFGADYPDAMRGSFRMIEAYLAEMKKLGVYDRATIIVTADHGLSNLGDKTLEIPTPYCPILLVKYPGQNDAEPLRTDLSPVAHDDLFATIEDALGAKRSGCGSGKPLKDFAPGEERERLFYYTALYNGKDGEIALREYAVTGDAQDLANWHLTGRWWDVVYSKNTISRKRFTDE